MKHNVISAQTDEEDYKTRQDSKRLALEYIEKVMKKGVLSYMDFMLLKGVVGEGNIREEDDEAEDIMIFNEQER